MMEATFIFLLVLPQVAKCAQRSLVTGGPRFTISPPSEVRFTSTFGAILNCLSTGSPTPKTTWIRGDGSPFSPNPSLVQILHNSSIIFEPFLPERYRADTHAGTLRCSSSNTFGTIVSPPITIQAVIPQEYSIRVESYDASLGGTGYLRCIVPPHLAAYASLVAWETPTKTIYPTLNPDGRYHMLEHEDLLLVNNVSSADQSTPFVCKVRDHLSNNIVVSLPEQIAVISTGSMSRPSILNKRESFSLREGAVEILTCIASGTPTPTVRWSTYRTNSNSIGSLNYPYDYDTGQVVNPSPSHSMSTTKPFQGTAVMFLNADTINSGEVHVCTANNSLGVDQMSVEINIERQLKVAVSPSFAVVQLGESATFTCSVSERNPSIIWYKNGSPLSATGRVIISGLQVLISSVNHEDSGMYQCMVETSSNRAQSTKEGTAQLVLGESRPILVYQFIEQTVQPGPPISLRCKALGHPLPKISWTKNGEILQADGRIMIREHSSGRGEVISQVNISSTMISDGGMFRCSAINSVGEDFHEANLNVYGPPTTRQSGPIKAAADRALKLFCPVSGFPLTTFTWSKDGSSVGADGLGRGVTGEGHLVIEGVRRPQDAGVYTCRASNRDGSSATGLVQVLVLVAPKISPFTPIETVVEGERKTLMCTVSKGDQPLVLRWLKNGFPIAPESPLTFGSPLSGTTTDISVMNLNAFNSALSIDRVSGHHAAEYSCEAKNDVASTTVSFTLRVNVPPRIEPFSFQDGLVEGMRTRVMCGVSQGDPPLILTWLKDGRPLSNLAGSLSTQVTVIDAFSSVLTITSLKDLHVGTYACEASNSAATVRAEAALMVYVPPSWIFEPSDATVWKGHPLQVLCLAKGSPQPSVVWKKRIDGGTTVSDGYRNVENLRSGVQQHEDGSLYISRAEVSHTGTYLCRASNNISHIDKTIQITVKSPPAFIGHEKAMNVRKGETAVLECRVRGDPSPFVSWLRMGRPVTTSHRSRDAQTTEPSSDILATLTLTDVSANDSGGYTCLAVNELGRNSQTIHLNINEPPSAPRGLRVLSVESRSLKVQFDVDDPRPTNYILQYRKEKQTWHESSEFHINPSQVEIGVKISTLTPSTKYFIRIIAINDLGRSPPSLELPVTTGFEKPGGAPTNIQLTPLSSQEVKVTWSPLPREKEYGDILGYNVGFAPISERQRHSQDVQYNFTTIENSDDLDGENEVSKGKIVWATVVKNLVPFHEYQFVLQAFNSEGAGPLSTPEIITTLEDVPGGPPLDLFCSEVSKDSFRLSWKQPEAQLRHGNLRGYRIEYEKLNGNEDTVRYTQVSAQTAVISGLEAATNYTIRINGFTSVGNGPSSSPIICATDEDLPGKPDGVRGVVSGPRKFIVSWGPPLVKGGVITSYDVTWRVVGSRLDVGGGRSGVSAVTGSIHWVQIEGVMGTLVEVEVVASTRKGRGPGATARVTLTKHIPAAIYSIGGTKVVHQGEDVTLPCGHVGEPELTVRWKYQDQPAGNFARMNVGGDAALYLHNVGRSDSGNYTCIVSNDHGTDQVTYSLMVLVPPESPLILASSISSDAVLVQWSKLDTGGAPITNFVLSYRRDDGIWTKVLIPRQSYSYTVKNLQCGSKYHLFVVAKNVVGSSPRSKTAVVKTIGSPPLAPEKEQFMRVNITHVNMYPRTWKSQGCPILQLNLEYRRIGQLHWIQVASGETNPRVVQVAGLDPSTSYVLRATTVSNAGSTSHSYHFTTLGLFGDSSNMWPRVLGGQWLSLRVLLPLMTSAMALASSIGLVCYCVKKKNQRPGSPSRTHHEEEADKKSESKFKMSQRDQYYATIRKVPQRDSQSDVPENAEDIHPYATFQLADESQDHDIPLYSIYHARNNPEPEPYSKVEQHRRRRSRSRSKSRNRGKSTGGESEDYEATTMASDTETEQGGGISSRTESSNQLDDVSSMREHAFSYSRSSDGVLTQACPSTIESHCEIKKDYQSVSYKDNQSGDTIYGGGPLRSGQLPFLQKRIHHNLLYHAESSTSPETSPTKERKSAPKRGKQRSKSSGGQDYPIRIVAATSTDSISQTRQQHRNPHHGIVSHNQGPPQGIPGGQGNDPQKAVPRKSSLQVSGHKNPFEPQGLKRPHAPNRGPSPSGAVLPGAKHGSRESVGDLDMSETECDRELLPPPRSYSGARFIRSQAKLSEKIRPDEGFRLDKKKPQSEKDYSIAV